MSVATLKVVVAHRPPLAFVDGTNGSTQIFTGYLLDLLPTLLQQANVDNPYELHAFQVCKERINLLMFMTLSLSSVQGTTHLHHSKRSVLQHRPQDHHHNSASAAGSLQLDVEWLKECCNSYSVQGTGGTRLRNGSWTGVMGELVSSETDIALFPLTLTSLRAQYIQHTVAFMDDGYGILIKTKKIDPGYSFLLPFQPLTWVMLLLSLIAVMMIISVLDYATRRARFKAIERAHGLSKVKRVRKRDQLMGHAIETIMMAVGSGSAPTSRSCSVKVMFVAWAIFSVIMLSAYTASLTANLTVNQLAVAIKSLSDLAQFSQPFGVPAESSVAAYFTNSSDKLAVSLRPKMIEYAAVDQAVQAVREDKLMAYINDYSTVQYYTQDPPCDLALGTETIGSGSLVLGLAANSTLAPALDQALLQLSEAGYLTELRRKWFLEASQCSTKDSGADGNGRLAISQAWSVFLILVVGAGVAALVAGLEMLYYRTFFHGIQKLKHDMANLGPRRALKRCISKRYSKSAVMSTSLTVTADEEDLEQPDISPNTCKDTDAVSFQDESGSHTATGSAAAVTAGIPVKVTANPPQSPQVGATPSGSDPAVAAAAASEEGSRHGSGISDSSRELHPRLTLDVLQQAEQQLQQPEIPGVSFSAWYTVGESSARRSVKPISHDLRGYDSDGSSSSSSVHAAATPHKPWFGK